MSGLCLRRQRFSHYRQLPCILISDGVFFGFVKSRERKNILHPPITIQLCLVTGSLAQVFAVPGQCFCCCGTVRQPHPSSSLRCHPPLWCRPSPPADLPHADPPWASRCPPHQSASRLVGQQVAYALGRPRCPPNQSASRLAVQVADAVEFWLCFPVFWHQSHSCVCSLLVIVSTLRSDNLFGL